MNIVLGDNLTKIQSRQATWFRSIVLKDIALRLLAERLKFNRSEFGRCTVDRLSFNRRGAYKQRSMRRIFTAPWHLTAAEPMLSLLERARAESNEKSCRVR